MKMRCFSHMVDEGKSSRLYSTCNQILPNIFQDKSFKKHNPMSMDERAVQEYSKLFFFLPSTMDRKEKINKFQKNVSLHPINCRYKDFQKYSGIGVDFKPEDLDSSDLEKRSAAKEIVLNFFKNPAQVSNWNLVRNANTLLTKGGTKINPDQKISWIEKSRKQQHDKYKFTY